MKNILKKCLPGLLLLFPAILFAQDNATESNKADSLAPAPEKPVKKYVKNIFENAVLINNQTVEAPSQKTLDFVIQHRFGVIKDGTDLYGFFAPSNIRLGLSYGITDRGSIGVGVTKNGYLADVQWKYVFLKQTKGGEMPITLAYYGNASRSMKEDDQFINQEKKYVADNRLSYFNELMVARKFGNNLGVQLAFTYSYINLLDSGMNNANYGVSLAARYKVTPQGSVMLDYDYPLNKSTLNPAKPNLGIGYEISTSGHQFQVFICTADGISNQMTRVYNQNDFTKGQFLIGFNITRQWSY